MKLNYHHTLAAIILMPLFVFLFCSCSGELSPKEHFQEALKIIDDEEKTALAIWHLQEFLADTAHTEGNNSSIILAKMHLQNCIDRFIKRHGEKSRSTDLARIQDLELRITLLEAQAVQRKNLISRINAENQILREELLRLQKK